MSEATPTEIAKMEFVHLHTHSHYSIHDGIPSVKALVKTAVTHSMPALALTDHDSLAGIVPFMNACRDYGIKSLVGCELTVGASDSSPSGAVTGQYFYVTLLVKNEQGYRNLVTLVTAAHKSKLAHPCVDFDTFITHTKGLIVFLGGPKTELFNLIALSKIDETERYISRILQHIDRENIRVEVQDHNENVHAIINKRLIDLAEFLNIDAIATNNVHYLHPEDDIAYQFFINKDPAEVKIERRSDARSTLHLATADEMRHKFRFNARVLSNTLAVAETCSFALDMKKKRFPMHDFTRGEDADSALWNLVFEKSAAKYRSITDALKERLDTEFNYIKEGGLSNYFLLLHWISVFLKENGIVRGAGRGKIVTSVISHVLGITDVDPMEYGFHFQGIGTGRDLFPMITIEIPNERVPDLLQFLQERYGESNICEGGKLKCWHRGVLFKKICEWAQLPKHKISAMLKMNILDKRQPTPIAFADTGEEASAPLSLKDPEVLLHILNVSHPHPSELKTASGQVVISGEDLSELVPCEFEKGEIGISQFDGTVLEALNLPRIHILSTPTMNIIDTALYWVHKDDVALFDLDTVSLSDYETFRLLGEGQTNRIPPFDEISYKSLLRSLKPAKMSQLIDVRSSMKKSERKPDSDSSDEDKTIQIIECITSYKCAYLKTHFRTSYMTGVLAHSYRSKKNFTILLREVEHMGIRVLPPDIGVSEFNFSREGDSIRTGLAVIKNMGLAAFTEIEKVRKGGQFLDLVDLCRRTNPRLIHLRLIANMIKASALDSFGESRAQMLHNLNTVIKFSRKREERRDGKGAQELTLFDVGKFAKVDKPPAEPEYAEMEEAPPETLIRDEVLVTGYSVTFPPLYRFEELLERIQAFSPYDVIPSLEGKNLYIAGFIDHIEREGMYVEYGIEMVVDLEGKAVVVPQNVYKRHSKAIYAVEPVLVGGRICRRGDEAYIKAHYIGTLKEVEANAAKVKRVIINVVNEQRKTLRKIHKLFKQYPGDTEIEIVNSDNRAIRLVRKIDELRVFFAPPVYYNLTTIVSKNAVEIIEEE